MLPRCLQLICSSDLSRFAKPSRAAFASPAEARRRYGGLAMAVRRGGRGGSLTPDLVVSIIAQSLIERVAGSIWKLDLARERKSASSCRAKRRWSLLRNNNASDVAAYGIVAGDENGLVASTTNMTSAFRSPVPLLEIAMGMPGACPGIDCPAST